MCNDTNFWWSTSICNNSQYFLQHVRQQIIWPFLCWMEDLLKTDDLNADNSTQDIYKKYRNLLSTLMWKSQQVCYDKYFETRWNNIENIWKGIKSLGSLKTVASSVPTVLSLDNGETTTNPYDLLLLRALIITLHLQLKLQKIA